MYVDKETNFGIKYELEIKLETVILNLKRVKNLRFLNENNFQKALVS